MIDPTSAGAPMVELYETADNLFPLLEYHDVVFVDPDTDPASWGLAWYRGLDALGRPHFAVRHDFVLSTKVGYHEAGHAFEDIWARNTFELDRAPSLDSAVNAFRTRYWLFRGFPGTWQEAAQRAAGLGGMAGWSLYPGESVAEAFSAAVSGIVQSEWTEAYGSKLEIAPDNIYDPVGGASRARAFFLKLMEEAEMYTDADRAMLQRVKDLLEAEGPKVWTARAQRTLDVETGKPYDPNVPPADPRIAVRKPGP